MAGVLAAAVPGGAQTAPRPRVRAPAAGRDPDPLRRRARLREARHAAAPAACSPPSCGTASCSCRCARCSSSWARPSRGTRRRETADVSKPGSDVKVTVGKPVVVVNGEDRPLDVPPTIYRGAVVVPVRVISEAMGAYVQWIPDRRVVVVRLLLRRAAHRRRPTPPPRRHADARVPPRRPPPRPPTAERRRPSPRPAVSERSSPATTSSRRSLQRDQPRQHRRPVRSRCGARSSSRRSGCRWMLEGDYREFRYAHNAPADRRRRARPEPGPAGCGTVVGNAGLPDRDLPLDDRSRLRHRRRISEHHRVQRPGPGLRPGVHARENDVDVRLGLKVFEPRVYLGAGYLTKSVRLSRDPRLTGAGFGVSKLPDLDQPISLRAACGTTRGSPATTRYPDDGAVGAALGTTMPLSYCYWKYRAGATVDLGVGAVRRPRLRRRTRHGAQERAVRHRLERTVRRARDPLLVALPLRYGKVLHEISCSGRPPR